MTTLELYRQLRAGKVSKDKFIYEVRKDSRIPWVNNLTSYEDSIKILKNKGIISEAYSIPQAYSIPEKGITDPVELDLQQHREYEDTYEKAIDMAARENGMDPEKLKNSYSRADALGDTLSEMDINDPILMQIRANANQKSLPKTVAQKPSAPNNKEFQKAEEIRRLQKKLAQLLNSQQDSEAGHFGSEWDDDMANDYADTKLNPIQQQIDRLRGPEKNVYMSKAEIDRRSAMMNESHKLTTSQIIDRLSPYDFKIGLEFEIKKEKDLKNIDIDKIKERVAKKLQKNPKAYRDTKHPDSKKAIKQDEKSKMIDVKEKNLKDKGNEMTKAKGQTVKANTKSSKAENRKGKPAGVKEMKPSNKSPKGVKKMEIPGKEKILENILARIRKKKDSLVEMYETPVKRDDYKSGQIVKVAENTLGKITNIQGSIIEYELEGGDTDSITYNVLDSLNGINQHDNPYKDKKTSKLKLDQMWKDWDERGEKTFGGMLTDPEHFKKPLDYKKIIDKLKNYLNKKKLKKEALIKIGKDTVITPDENATNAIKKLGGQEIPGTKGVVKVQKPGGPKL